MAGLGKYKKGAKFTLRSGNKPTFTQMGSSPAKITGIGARVTGANTKKFTPNIDHITKKDEKEDSPANLNNFGIGQGGSPYHNHEEGHIEIDPNGEKEEKSDTRETGNELKPKEGTKAGDSKEPTWKKALKVGTTLLSGGIQGVYGGKREKPKINFGKWSQEELDKSAADNILAETGPPLPLSQAEKDARALKLKNEASITKKEE